MMQGAALNWNHPDLLETLSVDGLNGFGFQCDSEQSDSKPTHLYIAKVFHGKAKQHKSYVSHQFGKTDGRYDEDIFIEKLQAKLCMTSNDVWVTDWLGRDFLTVNTCLYNDIPKILNATLKLGYRFTTHSNNGNLRMLFVPGEEFSRINFEMKVIKYIDTADEIQFRWMEIYLRPCCLHWNWATTKGNEFCTRLRVRLHKKPRSNKIPRMCWIKYNDTATKYGILHKGGWSQYEPDLGEPLKKRVKIKT